MRYCIYCGKSIDESAGFCNWCGKSAGNPQRIVVDFSDDDIADPDPPLIRNNSSFVQKTQQFALRISHVCFGTTSRKRFSLAALIILMAAIGIGYYLWIPKMWDVERYKQKNDIMSLCRMIDRHGAQDRHLNVLKAAAASVLDSDVKGKELELADLLMRPAISTAVRVAIVSEYHTRKIIIPGVADMVVQPTLPPMLREELIRSTRELDKGVFDRRVQDELKCASAMAKSEPDKAIKVIEESRRFDVNGTQGSLINEFAYSAHVSKLKSFGLPEKASDVQAVIRSMLQIAADARDKQAKILGDISILIEKGESAQRSTQQEQSRLKEIDKERSELVRQIESIERDLSGTRFIRAFLIDRIEGNKYEISFNLLNHRDRAILKAVETSFETKGWFEMYVRVEGKQRITLVGGGSAEWPILVEDSKAERMNRTVTNLRGVQVNLDYERQQKNREISESQYETNWNMNRASGFIQAL